MTLSISQQILETIERSKNILLTFRQNWSVDAVASAIALSAVVGRMEKSHTIAAAGFQLPTHLQFLPGIEKVRSSLDSMRKFLIKLALRNTEIEEFTYDIVDGELHIAITPRKGFFAPHDVATASSEWRYDLVIVLDTPDLESLGSFYTEHPEFFYHTPIINIDHTTHNEHFGRINLVDVTTSSTAEVVAELLTTWDPKLMDETVATALLTGITAETESFRLPSVSPKTLSLASQLISLGAKREEIIANLYRTKTIVGLKLWGRALARLKQDNLARMVWSVMPAKDFEKEGGSAVEVIGVVDEMMASIPNTRLALLIIEEKPQGEVIVHARTTDRHLDLRQLFTAYHPVGDRASVVVAVTGKLLVAVERELIDEVREKLLTEKT